MAMKQLEAKGPPRTARQVCGARGLRASPFARLLLIRSLSI